MSETSLQRPVQDERQATPADADQAARASEQPLESTATSFDPASPVSVVVNPCADQGTAKAHFESLAPLLKKRYPNLSVQHTQGPGQATTLTQQALANGASMVIAFGGDGTVNEVLNGFVDTQGNNAFPRAILGILAAGSGSDFQRMFGRLPLHAQLAAFVKAPTQRVDYGVARFQDQQGQPIQRAFLNIASAGISGDVLYHLSSQHSKASATARYFRATLTAIVNLCNHQATVTMDQAQDRSRRLDLTLASVANGRFFGSGMEISPESTIDDGQLRVLTASVPTKMRLLALFARVYAGKHIGATGVHYESAQSVELAPVDPQRKIRLELDGEMVGHLPGHFVCRPRSLRIRVPAAPSKH